MREEIGKLHIKFNKLSERITKLNERFDKIDRSAPIYTERLSKLTSMTEHMKYELEQKHISDKNYESEFFRLLKPEFEKLIIKNTAKFCEEVFIDEHANLIRKLCDEYLRTRIDELNSNIMNLIKT